MWYNPSSLQGELLRKGWDVVLGRCFEGGALVHGYWSCQLPNPHWCPLGNGLPEYKSEVESALRKQEDLRHLRYCRAGCGKGLLEESSLPACSSKAVSCCAALWVTCRKLCQAGGWEALCKQECGINPSWDWQHACVLEDREKGRSCSVLHPVGSPMPTDPW